MSPRHLAALRDERGFTLVEILVTLGLAIVVLLAILGASEIFGKSATSISNSTSAQDSARTTLRSMVATLRQARFAPGTTSPVPATWTPSRSDLTIAAYVTTTTGTTELGWTRYCAATSGTQSSLIVGVRIGDAYAAPGSCSATDTTNGWTHTVVLDRTLHSPGALFDFSSPTCASATVCLPTGPDVRAVGIRLAVGTSRESAGTFSSVVRDAVSFRNRSGS
jgi:Tfp pilus assembly protein PilW